jgi:hypothetical protein
MALKQPYSYDYLHITTALIPRTCIAGLGFKYSVTCSRADGWQLFRDGDLVAGEYHMTNKLRLDVDGIIIVDSLTGYTNV